MLSSGHYTKAPEDSATELLNRFTKFLEQLSWVVTNFPVIKKSRAGSTKESKYKSLKQLLTDFHASGSALLNTFAKVNSQMESHVTHMAALAENDKITSVIINYFAASSVISLIQSDIEPLLRGLVYDGKISINSDFKKNFGSLMEHASNRSSKIGLLFDQMEKEAAQRLQQDEQQTERQAELNALKRIHARIDAVTRLSNLIAGFRIFAINQPKLSAKQLEARERAEKLSQEADEFVMLFPASKEAQVLIEFIKEFDLDLMLPLLKAMRNWEKCEENSASHLQAAIHYYIHSKDTAIFYNVETASPNLKVRSLLVEELAQLINGWMRGNVLDADLEKCIATLQANLSVPAVQMTDESLVSQIKHDNLLKHLNELLSTTELPDLHAPDSPDSPSVDSVQMDAPSIDEVTLPTKYGNLVTHLTEILNASEEADISEADSHAEQLPRMSRLNQIGMSRFHTPLPPPPGVRRQSLSEISGSEDEDLLNDERHHSGLK